MQKYMCLHTLPPHAFTSDHVALFADAAQHDPTIRGYRSFVNLSEGKVVCIMEGPDKDSVLAWFQKVGMPVDSICPVEIEGERGVIHDELAVGTA